jgi:catechol 2,3-dioxygenase-like lactoylglutathione lyase family enzyme
MKRFHVHVSVASLGESIDFYSRLFGTAPAVRKDDYAKWMLDDPRLNFAISSRGHSPGVNHLGVQVDSAEELGALRAQAQAAEIPTLAQEAAACCYAKSDKHWIKDPQGIAWETFHTLATVPVYGQDTARGAESEGACCVPLAAQARDPADAACCVPAPAAAGAQACCA